MVAEKGPMIDVIFTNDLKALMDTTDIFNLPRFHPFTSMHHTLLQYIAHRYGYSVSCLPFSDLISGSSSDVSIGMLILCSKLV